MARGQLPWRRACSVHSCAMATPCALPRTARATGSALASASVRARCCLLGLESLQAQLFGVGILVRHAPDRVLPGPRVPRRLRRVLGHGAAC